MRVISLVIPVFNEEKGLDILYKAVCGVINKREETFELIFVNDGSYDGSLEKLLNIHKSDPRVKIVDFSRNFGHQNALSAGIDFARGDAVILMDADMEDPPEKIYDFLEYWKNGYDVVYAIRKKRKVGVIKRTLFALYHKLNTIISDIAMPDASGIFGLMDRKVVNIIRRIPEKNRYLPGLRAWVGLKQMGLETERGKRYDKNPRVSFAKLIKLAFDSYISFSKIPLKIASFLGIFFSFISFIGILVIIFLKLTVGIQLRGWSSIIALILLVTGIQLITIGIIGEYIGRILDETKNRPLYIVKEIIGFENQIYE
ncbi:MAG: glycosyltransferase family 2 protein [Candidatus Omnitrophica bacterium]|nr:glycosyltransferase family 2 protein [Candidatus Omnitrophota bacterium]MDD5591918.1 glycosyltransferase family 2 protein [Candidatus Omnitrophota bacterium]